MAFEELKKDLAAADTDVRSYIDNSEEYLKLRIFKVLMSVVTSSAKLVLVGAITLLAILILSLAASYAIGAALDNTSYGFLIMGVCYLVIALICYFLRDRLNRPLLRKFSEYYFD